MAGSHEKERLDVFLHRQGYFPSRQRAQAAILAGLVRVNGDVVRKAGHPVPKGAEVTVAGEEHPYVSRGGIKLAHALDHFSIDVEGRICLDAGASTGGFTDCLLQRGAERVYAVDVGYGQLAWRLRRDPRVQTLERTNLRYLRPEQIGEPVSLATLDLSFISLTKVFGALAPLLTKEGEVVALVKPQFEAGRSLVGSGGVVRDPAVHRQVIERVAEGAEAHGLRRLGVVQSPITGPKGNVEFLMHLQKIGGAGSEGGRPRA